jgi:hypothetical protein
MSYKALSWALQQKGLKPITKIILISLADRHNPDYGCFPSIRKISDDTEVCVKSVYNHLLILEEKGLIKRTGRIRDNGQQTSNEYLLIGVQDVHGDYVNRTSPGVQDLHTNNLVNINHVNKPNMFNDAWAAYPRKVGKGHAEKAWAKSIKKIDETELCKLLSQYIDSLVGKDSKFIPHLSTWLNGERWHDDIEAPQQNGIDHMFRDMVNDLARVSR